MLFCVNCQSINVHSIEFRTDGPARTNVLMPVNEGVEVITDDDLSKYVSGYYCHECRQFCSVRVLNIPTKLKKEVSGL